MTASSYVGIDVAKAELVVGTSNRSIGRFANDRDGHRQLVLRLREMDVAAVVLESTGRYGQDVALALMAAGFAVAVVPPGRVRHYAKSLGIHAKTDPIDAQVIARFGEAARPRPLQPAREAVVRLRAVVDRRDQVIEMRKREQNHLEACADPSIAKELRRSITRLEALEARYTKQIAQHLAADEELARRSHALQAEAGVGLQTAATLLAHFPELGHLNRQRAAALAGLAPFNRDSGTRDGRRSIYGGRARLRRALYMAAISASRWNPWVVDLYRRLRQRGKCAKVALIACARKLLVRLNAIVAAAIHAAPGEAPPRA